MDIQIFFHILNNPISYLHHKRLEFHPEVYKNALSRTYVNSFIIDFYKLDTNIPVSVLMDPTVNLWVKNWYFFPHVTYLTGCHLLTHSLLWRGYIFSQPEWVRKFISSDGFNKKNLLKSRVIPDELTITSTGYSALGRWIESLPVQLKKRFELMFPENVIGNDNNCTIDNTTLTMVLNYVKNNHIKFQTSDH